MTWKVLSLPALAEDNDLLGRRPGEALWPERFPGERLREIRAGDPLSFDALYQQRPQPFEGGWFSLEWVKGQFYKELNHDLLNIYLVVDPALSKEAKSNYTAIWVFGAGEDHNFYWLYMLRERLDPGERADAIFRLHRQFHPIHVGYEEYGMVADTWHLAQKMELEHYHFKIIPLGRKGAGHRLSKPDRIGKLIPLFREGRILFPMQQLVTLPDGSETDIVNLFLEKEYKNYCGVGAPTDDMLDVMSRCVDDGLQVEFPLSKSEPAAPPIRPAGATWLSSY